MAKISDFALQMNGLHLDTKNIFYAYLIVEISLKNYKFYYHFDDITAANHKPMTL